MNPLLKIIEFRKKYPEYIAKLLDGLTVIISYLQYDDEDSRNRVEFHVLFNDGTYVLNEKHEIPFAQFVESMIECKCMVKKKSRRISDWLYQIDANGRDLLKLPDDVLIPLADQWQLSREVRENVYRETINKINQANQDKYSSEKDDKEKFITSLHKVIEIKKTAELTSLK